MKLKKVTAIVRTEKLDEVKEGLKELGVPHVSVDYVNGYENPHYVFEMPDVLSHARIEVLTEDAGVESVVEAMLNQAYVGTFDDGVVTVTTVDEVYKINENKTQKNLQA